MKPHPCEESNGRGNHDIFTRLATWTIHVTGGKWGFVTAVSVVLLWAITGPIFNYADEWQLVINTGTTIVTFLMVFLIQNTQNRESKAVHLKLDELIRAVKNARNEMIDIEHLNEEQLDFLAARYRVLAGARNAALAEPGQGRHSEQISPVPQATAQRPVTSKSRDRGSN